MKLKIKNYIIEKDRLPASLILHGILYVVFILALALSILFIIPIQEKIGGRVVIHTYGVPVAIKTKQEGLLFLRKADGDLVKKGELVATQVWDIDTSTYSSLIRLVRGNFDLTSNPGIRQLYDAAIALKGANLPEIQGYIQRIITAVSQYDLQVLAIDPSGIIENLNREISGQQDALPLIDSLADKKSDKLRVIRQQLERDQALVNVGALSKEEFSQTETEYIDAESEQLSTNIDRKTTEQNISELESAIAAQQAEYSRSKARILGDVVSAYNDFLEAYYRSAPDKFIYSSVSGQISKIPEIVNGLEMSSEETIMTVVPSSEDMAVEAFMYVGLRRAGEIVAGQNVFIELSEYNARDYGMVEGRIRSISLIPDSEQYRLDITASVPLTTNFGHRLETRSTYNGTGEILTTRMNIFQKIMRELKWNQAKYARSENLNTGLR